jgi:alpha-tubulin suppressor-like RCC1 family protein
VLLRDAAGQVRTGFAQVSAGWAHALAVDDAGVAWAWGQGDYGDLGNGSTSLISVDVPAPMQDASGNPLSGVANVQAGKSTSYALMADGRLLAFGFGSRIGSGTPNTSSTRATPVLTAPGAPLTDVTRVATHPSASHAMALRDDGTLWAWGRPGCTTNVSGCLLGDGATNFADYARQVRLPDGSAILAPRAFALEDSHSIVVLSDGTVLAWGLNRAGQLGDGTTTARGGATPVRTANDDIFDNVVGVAASFNAATGGGSSGCTIYLRGDSSVWANGDNAYGCIGDNTTVNRTTPVPVLEEGGAPLTGVTELFGSWDGIVVAKKADGSFWLWGTVRAGSTAQETWRTARRLTFFAP